LVCTYTELENTIRNLVVTREASSLFFLQENAFLGGG